MTNRMDEFVKTSRRWMPCQLIIHKFMPNLSVAFSLTCVCLCVCVCVCVCVVRVQMVVLFNAIAFERKYRITICILPYMAS